MFATPLIALVVAALAPTVDAAAGRQEAAPPPAAVELSDSDAVRPVILAAGRPVVLTLESNPSTGYAWEVVETINLRVEEPIEVVPAPSTGRPLVGAPGTAVIRLTPRGKGPASLKLIYKRPWVDASPEDRTLSFVFRVE